MKKVGIVTCYFKNNYGSVLQAYATKKVLDNNNIPNETINIDENIDFKNGKKKYYISQMLNYKFIKSKFGMIKLKLDRRIVKNLDKNIRSREEKYKEFRSEFNLSKSLNTYKELSEFVRKNYSDIIVGSDQLWLPVNVIADYYTLNWVPDNINKISYATSFGVSLIPKKYNEKYKKFLKRINHLSVREQRGVELVKNIAGLNAELVCDPTILLTKKEWDSIATKERIIKDKYILCYFLGSNIKHRKFAERLRKATGLKIVSLNHADEYVKYSDEYCDIAPYNIGPKDWINLIKNAEYICTDSFHGTVFSIIYNKNFFTFRRYNNNNMVSTNSRIDSLLDVSEISKEKILTGDEDPSNVIDKPIDYNKVNENIEKFRKRSREWLLEAINSEEKKSKHIYIKSKEMCTGCTACKNICPTKAIFMKQDEEGFIYPMVDEEKCINCGKCKDICPVKNKKENIQFEQKGCIFQYNDDNIRKQSTSGGAFTAISDYVIEHNGVVFGAAFDDLYKVKHQMAERESDLEKFRNSKYVQSDPGDTFSEVKEYLNMNKMVCYSGTPCQIEGLLAFLGKKYENLITVDVICRAVPSPLLWEKYLDYRVKDKKKLKKVLFREKYYGYKYSQLSIYQDNGSVYHAGVDSDPYLRAFFSNICDRPSCYNCKFKNKIHNSDFSIWDCFEVEKFDEEYNDDKGTTRILINSKKAMDIINEIKNIHKLKMIDVELLTKNFYQLENSVKLPKNREQFFEDLNNLEFEKLIKKYFPNTLKCRLEKNIRIILIKTKIYKPILKLGKKFRNRK